MRRTRAATGAILAAALAYTALDLLDVVPGRFSARPVPTVTVAPPIVTPTTAGSPVPTALAPATAGLDPAAPAPSPAGLSAALAAPLTDPAWAGGAVAVRDVLTGASVYASAANTPLMPASTTKLVSAVLVTTAFGPGERLVTSTVLAGTDQLVLVAGGDTLLAPGRSDPSAVAGRAGLDDLAAATAAALTARGLPSVTLAADLRRGAGPAFADGWSPDFPGQGIAGPVVPLALASDRAVAGRAVNLDPAAAALRAFAAALTAHGIAVRWAPDPLVGRPDPQAPVLAAVASAPVDDQLALALTDSDNTLVEALARQASVKLAVAAGGPAPETTTFAQVGAAAVAQLAADGVDVTGAALADASGLSRDNRLSAALLTEVLQRVDTDPRYARAVAGMPVAGWSGTLADRFGGPGGAAGIGVVRAKTGTLTGASALAGLIQDRDGRLLAFAALTAGAGTASARTALDQVAAVVAQCGCR